MNWFVLLDVSKFYFVAVFLTFIFSLPLFVFLIKKNEKIDLFLIYISGVLNLFCCLFFYASINYFWDIRNFSIVIFSFLLLFIELVFVFYVFRKNDFKIEISNGKWYGVIFLLSLGMFYYLNNNYFDVEEKSFFLPGYSINHDYVVSVSAVRSFFDFSEEINNSPVLKGSFGLHKETGYPEGGFYMNVFFAKLLKSDPYFLYQRVVLWLSLLSLFIINYFAINYFKKLNFLARFGLAIISVLSVFNFLSLSIINTSVLASVIVIPFVFFAILWTVLHLNEKEKNPLFLLFLLMSLAVVIFVYSYFNVIYYVFFIICLPFVVGFRKFNKKFLFKISVVFLISFLLPLNFFKTRDILKRQLSSDNKEINVFKGGTMGNTIGFVNPMITFSIWSSNADYRFFVANHYDTWLFFSFFYLLFVLIMLGKLKKSTRKLILMVCLPFLLLVLMTFWINKSSYQNVKALNVFATVWPFVLFLMLFENLRDKRWWLKLITILYLCVYCFFALKGAIFACSYAGRPLVKSNLELAKISDDFCQNNDKKLFLGRDELSVYFLIKCKNIFFNYDRFFNNQGFWEIIKLNKMSGLDAKCEPDSLRLTEIDYSVGYESILVDKCFKFKNDDYELVKEYEVYRWYKKKN